jgi:hypothetical protein
MASEFSDRLLAGLLKAATAKRRSVAAASADTGAEAVRQY